MDNCGNPVPLPPVDDSWLSGSEREIRSRLCRARLELHLRPLHQREPLQTLPGRAERETIPPPTITVADNGNNNPGFYLPAIPGNPTDDPNEDFDDDNPPDMDKTKASDGESDTNNDHCLLRMRSGQQVRIHDDSKLART
jgi:hypothetical protein